MLVRGDLFLQGLEFAIAPADVEFDLQILDACFALAELQLSIVGQHACLGQGLFGGDQSRFQVFQQPFGRADLSWDHAPVGSSDR